MILCTILQLWKTPSLKRHTTMSSAALGWSLGYFTLDIALVCWYFPTVCTPIEVMLRNVKSSNKKYAMVCLLSMAWWLLQMGGPEMLIHHIAAFVSVALASWTKQAHMYTLLLLSTEMTTPFVNARWILDQMVGTTMLQ